MVRLSTIDPASLTPEHVSKSISACCGPSTFIHRPLTVSCPLSASRRIDLWTVGYRSDDAAAVAAATAAGASSELFSDSYGPLKDRSTFKCCKKLVIWEVSAVSSPDLLTVHVGPHSGGEEPSAPFLPLMPQMLTSVHPADSLQQVII